MHDAAMQWVTARTADLHPASVLDLGGRNVNGTPRHLFNGARYVAVDLRDGPDVDIVADCATLDLGEQFDLVLSTELLEHAERPAEIIHTAYAHTRPGGWFVATMAGPGRGPHGASGEGTPPPGEWYRNIQPDELYAWLWNAGFDDLVIDQLDLDLRCTARRGE